MQAKTESNVNAAGGELEYQAADRALGLLLADIYAFYLINAEPRTGRCHGPDGGIEKIHEAFSEIYGD